MVLSSNYLFAAALFFSGKMLMMLIGLKNYLTSFGT